MRNKKREKLWDTLLAVHPSSAWRITPLSPVETQKRAQNFECSTWVSFERCRLSQRFEAPARLGRRLELLGNLTYEVEQRNTRVPLQELKAT
jgi:hypothetical protein